MSRIQNHELDALVRMIKRAEAAPEELLLACIRVYSFSKDPADLLLAEQLRRAILREMQVESRGDSAPQAFSKAAGGSNEDPALSPSAFSGKCRVPARTTGYSLWKRFGDAKAAILAIPT